MIQTMIITASVMDGQLFNVNICRSSSVEVKVTHGTRCRRHSSKLAWLSRACSTTNIINRECLLYETYEQTLTDSVLL